MVRLIAIDIDGTLLDSQARIPPAHLDAVAGAAARGIEIALVTGRSAHFARPVADLLPVPVTLVTSNGALVRDAQGVTRVRRLLARDAARRVLAATPAYSDSVALIFDRLPGDRAPADGSEDLCPIVYEHLNWAHPNRARYFARNRAFIHQMSPLADALVADPIQVMFNGGVGPMRELAAMLAALPFAREFSVQVTEYTERDFTMVDVNQSGCTKGSTLAAWAARQGLAAAEVMAVGDNLNDLEMLSVAGLAVVMGNASDDLKKHAARRGWRIAPSHDDDGLAAAIEGALGAGLSS
jgi:Cof subfamily protein (haloacid dehalogenase superfamily)